MMRKIYEPTQQKGKRYEVFKTIYSSNNDICADKTIEESAHKTAVESFDEKIRRSVVLGMNRVDANTDRFLCCLQANLDEEICDSISNHFKSLSYEDLCWFDLDSPYCYGEMIFDLMYTGFLKIPTNKENEQNNELYIKLTFNNNLNILKTMLCRGVWYLSKRINYNTDFSKQNIISLFKITIYVFNSIYYGPCAKNNDDTNRDFFAFCKIISLLDLKPGVYRKHFV